MTLKVFIDIFGRVGFCERFPKDGAHAGYHECLKELSDEQADTFEDRHAGFYKATLEWERCTGDPEDGAFLVIAKIEPWEEKF